jgi:hypothetical protein
METQEEIVENFSTVDDTFEFDVDDHGQENKNLISELEPHHYFLYCKLCLPHSYFHHLCH